MITLKTMENHWLVFRKTNLPDDADPDILAAFKRTFMAGAMVFMIEAEENVMSGKSPEMKEFDYDIMRTELTEFCEAVIRDLS